MGAAGTAGGSDAVGAGHACVRCDGQFFVGLASPGTVHVDYVFLQPGAWGRLGALPVRADGAAALRQMGVRAVRQGGSFTVASWYAWKKWRGPPWLRPSRGGAALWSTAIVAGWGPFEMVDLCGALGIEPVITLSADWRGGVVPDWPDDCCSPSDMADFVEYCHGDGATTVWGQQRVADGHPAPYNVRYIELGNEQYNVRFVDQVVAMERRATEVGIEGQLRYIFPGNPPWPAWPYLNDSDGARAEALGLGGRLLADLHVQGSYGGAARAGALFAQRPGWRFGAANLETNAGRMDIARALAAAADLNSFFNDPDPRVQIRTESFCLERSGHYSGFDQGMAMFLPNGTFLQPPGWVHQMVNATWLPAALPVELAPVSNLSASAQAAADGSALRVMLVNPSAHAARVTLRVRGAELVGEARVATLSAVSPGDRNSPAHPSTVAPTHRTAAVRGGDPLELRPFSFTVLVSATTARRQ